MSKIIYLASPYSSEDKELEQKRYEIISKISADLVSKHIIAFSPITYGHTLLNFAELPGEYSFWEDFCISFLAHSDELWVYMIPGWDSSKGIANEIRYAIEHRIPVIYKEL